MTQDEKAERFRALHEGDAFIIPNPWDAGSARVFAALGFQALATTSSGFAFTLGRRDGDATLDEVAAHVARAERGDRACRSPSTSRTATAPTRSDAANAIARVAEAGAVGGSIEDYDPDAGPLRRPSRRPSASPPPSRPPAASPFPFTLTARAENHIRGNPDLDDTIARLQAYERAGADVLFAPGLRTATRSAPSAPRSASPSTCSPTRA